MEEEMVVLCDDNGVPTGVAEKISTHHADTPRHLAFSVYVFNDRGEFLVTQRALVKKVWPGAWSNSCCGHLAPGESTIGAIKRRLDFELGMAADGFQVLIPDYKYETTPFKGVIDREFCPVYIARVSAEPVPNPSEIEDYKWVTWQDFLVEAEADTSDKWSWWCKDQLRLLKDHSLIKEYSQPHQDADAPLPN